MVVVAVSAAAGGQAQDGKQDGKTAQHGRTRVWLGLPNGPAAGAADTLIQLVTE